MEKVQMKNVEVIGLVDALNSLIKAGVSLSPRTWFTLTANRKKLIDQSKLIDEARLELVKTHKMEGVDNQDIPEETAKLLNSGYNDILSIDVDVEIVKLPIQELEKETKKLGNVSNIYLLFDYVIEGEKKKTKNGKGK